MQFAGIKSKRRKPSLTPMIDVVFLLLVFFMLSSQFGLDQVIKLPLSGGNSTARYDGPPRLVAIGPEGARLNGVALPFDVLVSRLNDLTTSNTDLIILRGINDATTQDVLDILNLLKQANFESVVLVE